MTLYRTIVRLCLLLASLLMLGGCASDTREDRQDVLPQKDAEGVEEDEQLYVLLYTNPDTQKIFVQSIETRRQIEYEYTGGTYIRDRYGNSMTIDQLQVGELVRLTHTRKDVLTDLNIAEDTFCFDGASKFRIDAEKSIITIADTKYFYDEALKIFSEDGIISLNELSTQDILCLRGQDKQIHSIVVCRGHGTVTLRNTDLFVGGMITIGNVVAQRIQEEMTLELPEGTYRLSVANDGYGGSMEITVNRFEELEVDLELLEGDGPQFCQLKFNVDPEDAVITLAGGLVDNSQLLELRYGSYRLIVEAEGYETFSGTLVVSSPEAVVSITLQEEDADSDEDTEDDSDTDTDSEDDGDEDADTETTITTSDNQKE